MPKIYLSPSTQEFNEYVIGGSEEFYMNLVADAMEPYLQSSGITYIRNTPEMTARSSIAESNASNVDLHVALHSNAGGGEFSGKLTGTDVYFAPEDKFSKAFADIVAKNFKNIYYDPKNVTALPTYFLGEVLRTNAPASLIEIAYHDNVTDANWIKNNINAIAQNISLSIAEYFGIPLISPQPVTMGTVTVKPGSSLNIRAFPSVNSDIIGEMHNGEKVKILGQSGDWFVINYNGTIGYSATEYIQ